MAALGILAHIGRRWVSSAARRRPGPNSGEPPPCGQGRGHGGMTASVFLQRRYAVTNQVLEQRAAIEKVTAGRTLCDVLLATAQTWGDLPAYSDRDGGPWQTITWQQTRELALRLAAGFMALGLQRGERVAMMLPNRVEHVLADYGAVHAGGVPVTFYATLAADQIGYVARDCDARIAVVDGAEQLARWQGVLAE